MRHHVDRALLGALVTLILNGKSRHSLKSARRSTHGIIDPPRIEFDARVMPQHNLLLPLRRLEITIIDDLLRFRTPHQVSGIKPRRPPPWLAQFHGLAGLRLVGPYVGKRNALDDAPDVVGPMIGK